METTMELAVQLQKKPPHPTVFKFLHFFKMKITNVRNQCLFFRGTATALLYDFIAHICSIRVFSMHALICLITYW